MLKARQMGNMGFPRIMMAVIFVLIAACGTPTSSGDHPVMQISFLTRAGCVNSHVMRERLRDALAATGVEADMTDVDVGNLEADDPLTGYGTPTVLLDGVDMFGAAAPGPGPPS